jgi:hypothetical protein
MAKLEFVGVAIDKLEGMAKTLAQTPEVLAEEFLKATLIDEPRPPWNTGELRNSGGVYIGNQLYMTTQDVAYRYGAEYLLEENPNGWYVKQGKSGMASGRHYSDYGAVPQRFSSSKFSYKESGSTGSFDSFRNKVTVIYQAPHAELMHEWPGKFTDPQSGAHFISDKMYSSMDSAAFRLQSIQSRREHTSGDYMSDNLDLDVDYEF